MSDKLNANLVAEWNKITNDEPIREDWADSDLKRAIAAIKKARGMGKKSAKKVNKRIEKSRPLTAADEPTGEDLIEDVDAVDGEPTEKELKETKPESNATYPEGKVSMTDEGKAALKKQADDASKEEPTKTDTSIQVLGDLGAGRRVNDPNEMVTVRLVEDVPRFFYGSAQRGNGTWYGPYRKGARLRVPNKILFVLEKGGKV